MTIPLTRVLGRRNLSDKIATSAIAPLTELQHKYVRKHIWGLIKRSLQGVMYSGTVRLGLNPSAKDRRWSSRTYFFAKEFALDFWRHACALTYLQTPLPCRGGYAAPTLALLIPCLC